MTLDALDRRILDTIQHDFPVTSHPFRTLAEQLDADEEEVLERVRRMQDEHVIREIGPVFDVKSMGFVSTLCAARVDAGALGVVTAFVNSFAEVTHNYLREDAYNVWFTVIAPNADRLERILNAVRGVEGVETVLSLPAKRTFKINVRFRTEGGDA